MPLKTSAKKQAQKTVRVGHSPDPDDAFMFYALAKGKVPLDGFKIKHVIEDIQSLNQRALTKDLEVTAISAAVYPMVADDYWILSCGASVGRNYGPIVVAEKKLSEKDLKGKRIAVPGLQTTAYLLLKIFLGDFEPVVMDFAAIIGAVKRKEVDAGLIIHEGQLNYASFGLAKCMDLGESWFKKFSLPIPLGLDVVRKDMGLPFAKKLNRTLKRSIAYARDNHDEALVYALKFGRGIPAGTASKFVGMYVNEDTLDLGEEGKAALEKLFKSGAERGLFSDPGLISVID